MVKYRVTTVAVTNLLYCAFVQIPSECTYDGVYSLIMKGNLHVHISKNTYIYIYICIATFNRL